jgi:hypothetical protein
VCFLQKYEKLKLFLQILLSQTTNILKTNPHIVQMMETNPHTPNSTDWVLNYILEQVTMDEYARIFERWCEYLKRVYPDMEFSMHTKTCIVWVYVNLFNTIEFNERTFIKVIVYGFGKREHDFMKVTADPLTLQYVSDENKANREIVMAAVQQNGWALQYAADALKADRTVVLAAVQQKGWALEFAAPALQADRGIVLAAVQQNGIVLQYASDELKGDREIVLAAVTQNGNALEFAAPALKADREIMTMVELVDDFVFV